MRLPYLYLNPEQREAVETVLREFDVHMAILASRPEGLQTLVDRVCAAGVHAVLNFVPKRVGVPAGCFIEETDIASKLEMLSFGRNMRT